MKRSNVLEYRSGGSLLGHVMDHEQMEYEIDSYLIATGDRIVSILHQRDQSKTDDEQSLGF
jgi:hypothetical protein